MTNDQLQYQLFGQLTIQGFTNLTSSFPGTKHASTNQTLSVSRCKK